MTGNQIAYWNLQETMRTNKANEDIKSSDVKEKIRSNKSNEFLKLQDLNIKDKDVNSQIQRRQNQNMTDNLHAINEGINTVTNSAKTVKNLFF